MLFATLDTQQRSIKLDSNHEFILVDTVGFVSRLPHGLVEAFKATLEEVNYADLLLHVVDASFAENEFQIQVTDKVLSEIGASGKEKVMVFNKMDIAEEMQVPEKGEDNVFISARTGKNMDMLLQLISDKIFGSIVKATLLIPYDRGDLSSYICEKAVVLSMDYKEDGTEFTAELSQADYQRLKKYER
jgi:GTP-binding protein HflX